MGFRIATSGNPSFNSSFGIVDEITATAPATDDTASLNNLNGFLGTTQSGLNAVGFSAVNNANTIGVNTHFGSLANASTVLNSAIVAGTDQVFTLTVNTDGSAEFDLDGTSGSLAAGAL